MDDEDWMMWLASANGNHNGQPRLNDVIGFN
jgi:hypothetical protein